MSLINDALRRAREQQKKTPLKGPAPAPVPAAPANHYWHFILGLFIVLLLTVAGILIFLATRPRSGQPVPVLPASSMPVVSSPPPRPAPVVPAAPAITTAPVANPAPVTALPFTPPAPAGPRLQGILYDVAHSTAIISGKTVRVGSTINGYKVKAIFPTEVDLIGPDQSVTNLMLPQ